VSRVHAVQLPLRAQAKPKLVDNYLSPLSPHL